MITYAGKNLVFLVGCPRSGTTWLQKLLASHTKVRTGEESHLFSLYIGPQLRAWKSQKLQHFNAGVGHAAGPPAYFREEEFFAILKKYVLELLSPLIDQLRPDELFLEKTPSHALFIPEIKELLPESRFIHILRDPRDVVASLMAVSRSWGATWAPTDAKTAAAMWIQHVQAVQSSSRNLRDGDIYQVNYEKLWNSPRDTLKDLAIFLGLSWNEDAIDMAVETNKADVMESGGTPIPVYGEVGVRIGTIAKLPNGFVRRARPNAWKSDLSKREQFKVWRSTRKTMASLGYTWHLRDWL